MTTTTNVEENNQFSLEEEKIYESLSYQQKVENATIISHPMATAKMAKKLMKLITSGSKEKNVIQGVKAIQKSIKKKRNGIVVLAGDVTPIDMIVHIPYLCETSNIPYVFIPCRRDLGISCNSRSPISVLMLLEGEACSSKFQKMYKKVSNLPHYCS